MYLKSTKLLKEDLTKKDEVRQRAGHRETIYWCCRTIYQCCRISNKNAESDVPILDYKGCCGLWILSAGIGRSVHMGLSTADIREGVK